MKTTDFERQSNNSNGNPRYAIHFLELLTEKERTNFEFSIQKKYSLALARATKIGGKKYHNKKFGGGIIFVSYNLTDTIKTIKKALKS